MPPEALEIPGRVSCRGNAQIFTWPAFICDICMFPKPLLSGTIYIDMSIRFELPLELRGAVDLAAADWQANKKVDRFWQKDPSLWTRDGEENWMGWIDIVERQQKDLANLAELGADVETGGFETVLLLGMGGSSLCPEVLSATFGRQDGFPAL